MRSDTPVAPPDFVRLAAHPLRWQLLAELAGSDCRVRELVDRVAEPQNLVSYHLRLLRDGGLVTATRSSFDGREAYYHLDLDRCADGLAASGAALHPALRAPAGRAPTPISPPGMPRVSVLFVCTGNSARSPMAEALLRHRAGRRIDVSSAGSLPKGEINPAAVRVLRESFGIDISRQRPRHLDTVRERRFDFVITLCDRAREVCPEFGGQTRRVHWSVPDPSAAAPDAEGPLFERTARDIDTRVHHLLPVLQAAVTHTQEVEQ
jgi:protein-tyrosine-phosphatase/DNA-binding transcriptional ArsR family regulator